jgi:hypothetical protein
MVKASINAPEKEIKTEREQEREQEQESRK